jgi:hypothetical protein
VSVEAELAALLKASQPGTRLIHLHLGRLQAPPSVEQRQAIRKALRELGKTADAWRLFDIANGDLLMLYEGLKASAAEATCRQIAGLLPGAVLGGMNPYRSPEAILVNDPGPAGGLYDLLADPRMALRVIEKN